MAIVLKSLFLGFFLILMLMPFTLGYVSAQTYQVVIVGAIPDITHANHRLLLTPIYGTDVVNDTANGVLKFKVISNLDGDSDVLGASNSTSDVGRTPADMPIFKPLQINDVVEVDFRNCQYSQLSVEKIPSTYNFLFNYSASELRAIIYYGQATSVLINSKAINSTAIPEFPNVLCFAAMLSGLMVFEVLLARKRSKNKSSSRLRVF